MYVCVQDKLSAADVSVYSSVFPLWHSPDLKAAFLADCAHLLRWSDELAASKAVQVGTYDVVDPILENLSLMRLAKILLKSLESC